MICEVRSLESRIKTHSFLEDIITSCTEVFKDCECDMTVGFRKLGNPTRETAKTNVIVKRTPGSQILTLELQAKISDL